MKTVHLIPWTIKVDPKIRKIYRSLAKKERTTPSALAYKILVDYLKNGGSK